MKVETNIIKCIDIYNVYSKLLNFSGSNVLEIGL